MVRLSVDTSQLLPNLLRIEGQLVNGFARKAGASAVLAMKSEASKQIRKDRPLKVKWVNRLLFIRKPTVPGDTVWHVGASPAPVPAIAFPTRQTKSGVSVEVNRGRRTIIKGSFLATMKSGHKGVFTRVGKKRLPISEEYTGRISELFLESSEAITSRGSDVFVRTFQRLAAAWASRGLSSGADD